MQRTWLKSRSSLASVGLVPRPQLCLAGDSLALGLAGQAWLLRRLAHYALGYERRRRGEAATEAKALGVQPGVVDGFWNGQPFRRPELQQPAQECDSSNAKRALCSMRPRLRFSDLGNAAGWPVRQVPEAIWRAEPRDQEHQVADLGERRRAGDDDGILHEDATQVAQHHAHRPSVLEAVRQFRCLRCCASVSLSACLCVRMYVCICDFMYVCIHVRVYVCMNA